MCVCVIEIFHTSKAHLSHVHEGCLTSGNYIILYYIILYYITTSASYSGSGPAHASCSRSEPAPLALECTLQQAIVSLPKGMPLN